MLVTPDHTPEFESHELIDKWNQAVRGIDPGDFANLDSVIDKFYQHTRECNDAIDSAR